MSNICSIQHFSRLTIFVFFACLCTTLLPAWPLSAEMVDKVVAVVNSDVITLSELEKEGAPTFRKIAATTPPEQLAGTLAAARAEILETLIDKRLITQKATAKNISVTDQEVDAAFNNVLQRSGMDRKQILQKLDEAGVNEAIYRSTLRTQIMQNKLVGSDVSAKVIITEEMILDYYDTHYVSRAPQPQNTNREGYYLLQIGCSWGSNNDAEKKRDAQKRIEQAYSLVKSGEDFKEVAKKYSDLPSAADGGDLGTFELSDMARSMRDAVANLQGGEVSQIVETPSGYQFFKVLSADGGNSTGAFVKKGSYEEVKDEIKRELYDQEMKKAYAEWVKELKDQAYIQKL